MAVYKRTYQAYEGSLTAEWSRFLILPRYAWRTLFQQRLILIFYVMCFFYPVGALIAVYLNANLGFLAQYINVPSGGLLEVGNQFFVRFLGFQGGMAFILTAFVGPGLISPDLANNALPLFFCRPFSRTEYVLGKLSVIALLLSFITWVPGLLIYCVQWSLAGSAWFDKFGWMAVPIVLGSVMWILLISLLALALSAWVRWKVVAGALLLVIFFLGAGLGQAINGVMRTEKGAWLDLGSNIGRVWAELFRIRESQTISVEEAWMSLCVVCAVALWLLWRKVRAYEVIS
jgi:ABC-2 type transport system permease protein